MGAVFLIGNGASVEIVVPTGCKRETLREERCFVGYHVVALDNIDAKVGATGGIAMDHRGDFIIASLDGNWQLGGIATIRGNGSGFAIGANPQVVSPGIAAGKLVRTDKDADITRCLASRMGTPAILAGELIRLKEATRGASSLLWRHAD